MFRPHLDTHTFENRKYLHINVVPELYDKQDDHFSPTKNNLNCSFPNTPMISSGVLVCGSYYSSSSIG